MINRIVTLGLLALLTTGCVKHYHNNTYPQASIPTAKVETPASTSWKIPTQKSVLDRESCDLLYTTYKGCYGLGIQFNNTNMCIESGVQLSESISSQIGSQDLGTVLGSVCAVACETANQNMAMPSYNDFSQNACN